MVSPRWSALPLEVRVAARHDVMPLRWSCDPVAETKYDALSLTLRDLSHLPAMQICDLTIAAIAPDAGTFLLSRVEDPEKVSRVLESTSPNRAWAFTQLTMLRMCLNAEDDRGSLPPTTEKPESQGLLLEAFLAASRLMQALDVTVPPRTEGVVLPFGNSLTNVKKRSCDAGTALETLDGCPPRTGVGLPLRVLLRVTATAASYDYRWH